ncbi:helix-turn-helix domain-containing protein [Acinetobacter modestus]|uniref:helix-turn-helix domain-containing protein n=1 Tax=Acinetobacter modestus TaxID=1776740 RepID=UPI0030158BF2
MLGHNPLPKVDTVISERDIEQAIANNDTKELIIHLENVIVQKALIMTRGNVSRAAEMIGMNRGTLSKIRVRAEKLITEG